MNIGLIKMEKFIRPKPFAGLKCSDNFMFAKIMEDEETCRAVLELLLDIKIDRLTYPETEKKACLPVLKVKPYVLTCIRWIQNVTLT